MPTPAFSAACASTLRTMIWFNACCSAALRTWAFGAWKPLSSLLSSTLVTSLPATVATTWPLGAFLAHPVRAREAAAASNRTRVEFVINLPRIEK